MRKLLLYALFLMAFSSTSNAQVGRWYSYSDFVVNISAGLGGDIALATQWLWNDTTARFYSSGSAPGYYRNYFVSNGMSFAPRLSAWDDHTLYGSSIKVGPTDVFVIDSVTIRGVYYRNNAITTPRDTLRLGFVYGDGTTGSNMPGVTFSTAYYGSSSMAGMLYDSVRNIAARNPASSVAVYRQDIILSNTDTASDFNRKFALTTPFSVPAGQIAAMSLTFKSGDPSYFPGDTVLRPSDVMKHGAFFPLIVSYASSPGVVTWAPFVSTDSNMGYYRNLPQTGGWNGRYIPQYAWNSGGGPSSLQYPVYDFHITCPTCRLNEDIAGTATLCQGATTPLSHGLPGGTWSSSAPAVATVSGGTVTGVSGGTATITYNVSGNFTTRVVTVTPLPTAATVTGPSSVCEGATIFFTPTISGGTWSSTTPAVATVSLGTVTGVSGGTATISYTLTNSCGSTATTRIVTVNPLPDAGTISGPAVVCVGSSITLSSSGATGGTWSSVSGLVTVSSSGVVTGVTAGVDVISYIVTNSCGTNDATYAVTVDVAPSAGTLSGATSVCIGAAIIVTPSVAGGTWAASNGNATVSTTGDVTGVTAGPVNISYSITGSCASASVVHPVTVIDCTVSVSEVAGQDGISIFPNPANSNITITAAGTIGNVVITDVVGRKVFKSTFKSNTAVINVSSLPDGVYSIRVNDTKNFRIVKQ